AQYAAKRIGRTTVLQHAVVDATGDVYAGDRLSEPGRDLPDAAELRQMAEHTQAVAIIGSAPPVRFGFPRCAKTGPLAHPLPREIVQPASLADAETAFANRKTDETEKTQDEPATNEVSPMPDLVVLQKQAPFINDGRLSDPESHSEVCSWPKPISSSGVTISPTSSFSASVGICATPSAIAISKK